MISSLSFDDMNSQFRRRRFYIAKQYGLIGRSREQSEGLTEVLRENSV